MIHNIKINQYKNQLILGVIWLAVTISDRLWFVFDRTMPAWDQSEHLINSLNYWEALKNPQWFSQEWWTNFWMISSKMPPLTYILTVPFLNIFGIGEDKPNLVYLLFTAILIISIYNLGKKLFNNQVGLWAAVLCVLMPGLYRVRLDFLLDYPLTAIVTLSFCLLTFWKLTGEETTTQIKYQWFWALTFGISFGLGLLIKQTFLFFLFFPLLWVGITTLKNKQWGRLLQLISSLCISLLIFYPWYRTNWLLILTSGKRATIDSAIAEGDPSLNTLDAWVYYWKILPYLISWPLLLVPIIGLIIYLVKKLYINPENINFSKYKTSIIWLLVFWVGAYFLCSLNINKDTRYVLPYLPVLALFLAKSITLWRGRWVKHIHWGTISLAILLMFLNIWPIGGAWLTKLLSPLAQHYAILDEEWPHKQVIAEITKTEPYLTTNLGVLPSTPEINQHNLNYYGALQNFQVYGRQVGVKLNQVPQDVASLFWFVTKTGQQGSVPQPAQMVTVQAVENGPAFQLKKSWELPDTSTLKLYNRIQPPIRVKPIKEQTNTVKLVKVQVPDKVPPGKPVSVIYEWIGPWEHLRSGIVLLTWQKIGEKTSITDKNQLANSQSKWLHDRAFAMGNLHSNKIKNPNQSFQIIEQAGMLPPAEIEPGNYTLVATYLNRKTGETYPIPVPPFNLTIDANSPPLPAPELDLITQLRMMAAGLPKGIKGIEPIFTEIARINQYDPVQDYTNQAEIALEYRLKSEPENLEYAYTLSLARVLQRKVQPAINALQKVVELDGKNPYSYTYLAFVNLYDFRAKTAAKALDTALELDPNQKEIQGMRAIAALMQGNLIEAWNYGKLALR